MTSSINIKSPLQNTKRYYAISVILSKETVTYHGVLIRDESQGDFYMEDQFTDVSFSEVISTCKNDYPILLNFEGDPIASRHTTYQEGYIKKILFRADLQDFYIYEMIQDTDVFVSYTRKNMIDPILEDFTQADFQVIRYTLGPFVVKNILPYIEEEVSVITTGCSEVTLSRKQITSFNKSQDIKETIYTVLNESISHQHLTALSLFIEEKINASYVIGSEAIIKKNREDSYYKKIFKKGGVIAILFIICSLLIGHILKTRTSKAFFEKQSEISYLQQSQATIDKLIEDKKNKEYILTHSGFNRNAMFTEYISGITNSVPSEIVLISLEVQPPEKKVKPNEKIDLDFNLIKISGISNDDTAVDTWIDALKEMSWIKRIEVTDYERNRSLDGSFELTVEIS
ncbi:hypothetical protein [Dokdonia sp.]|uniref:hypothetical protein n=1 Tax=Dokdonia sp. TaxID=2024995 RepID=UPI0032674181